MPQKQPLNQSFRDKIYLLVSQIPKGKVMTYGQIAAMCGRPRAARIVGGIASSTQFYHQNLHVERSGHTSRVVGSAGKQAGVACPLCDLPWQRVVKKDGSLAEGYPGGIAGHESVLRQDGVTITDGRVNMRVCLWQPKMGGGN